MAHTPEIVNLGGLAQLINAEVQRLGWTNREAAEQSRIVAEQHGYTRTWGKGTISGISHNAWHTIRTGKSGTPDLEILVLVALTLRAHGSSITLRQLFEAMGLDMEGSGTQNSQARALLDAMPEAVLSDLASIASLPPQKYRIVTALLVALQQMGLDEQSE